MAPYIIYNKLELEKLCNKKKIESSLVEDIFFSISNKRECLLCCDKNIPIILYSDNYKKDLISETIKSLNSKEKNKLEKERNEIQKKLVIFNKIQKKKEIRKLHVF